MATTKLNLVFQSDQVLDAPRVKTKVVLQTLDADQKLNLTFAAPAGADRNVNFPDPGADDTVVYVNKAQTLTNKTLGSGTTLPDQPQYAHLAGQAGGQVLQGGTAGGENLELESTSNAAKGLVRVRDNLQLASNKTLQLQGTGGIQMAGGTITGVGGLVFTTGTITGVTGITLASGELLGLPNTPSAGNAATSKNYVDGAIAVAVSGGVAWRETLLTASQLDSVNNGIAQAVAFYLTANPVSGDTLIVRDSTGFDQYSFGAGPGTVVAIGGTASITMNNLVSAIQGNGGGRWTAASFSNLQSINTQVIIIWKKIPDAGNTDRIYGAFSPATIAKHVNFGGLSDYRSSTVTNVPSVDPGNGSPNFGFGRVQAALGPSEVHIVRAEDSAYEYNDDITTWQLSAGAVVLATSGPGGGVIGQATFDSSLGLSVSAGVASVKVDNTSVSFNGSGQLQVAGGAVPLGTSANNGVSGGATPGKVAGDELQGVHILGDGTLRVKVDGSTMTFDPSGNLHSTPVAQIPTGLVSQNVLFTQNIPAVTAPTSGAISTDIPTLDHPDGSTTGQFFDITVPDDYDSGPMEILAVYAMSSAFAGNVRLQTQAKIVKATAGSIDTATFPAADSTLSVPATTNPARSVVKTLTAGTFTKGDTIQVYVSRLGADGADTHTGSWRVIAYEYRYTGQVATRLATQVIEAFTDAAGENTTTPGVISTDIPTVDFPTTPDTAQKFFFVVPDYWDGSSDALIRVTYAMSSATSSQVVRLTTSGNQVDVFNNAVTAIPAVSFDVTPSNDTNPHLTVPIRALPGATLHKGDIIELKIKRDTSVGSNHTGSFKLVNAHVTMGIAPVLGVTQAQIEEKYLVAPTFNVVSGTGLSGDVGYPSFAGDFATMYTMSKSTSGAGQLDLAFSGRLASFQTLVNNVKIATVLLSGAAPTLTYKVYVEGQGATPILTQVVTPTGTYTETTLSTALLTQPNGSKRYFVTAEAAFTGIGSIGVSVPFARVS